MSDELKAMNEARALVSERRKNPKMDMDRYLSNLNAILAGSGRQASPKPGGGGRLIVISKEGEPDVTARVSFLDDGSVDYEAVV